MGDPRGLNEALANAFKKQKLLRTLFDLVAAQTRGGAPAGPREASTFIKKIWKEDALAGKSEAHVSNLRTRVNLILRDFYASHPNEFPSELSIDTNYRLAIVDRSRSVFASFWSSSFLPRARTIVDFSSPLFFRIDSDRYVRNIHTNEDHSTHLEGIRSQFGVSNTSNVVPSSHYFSAGEVVAALNLSRAFAKEKLHFEFLQYTKPPSSEGANWITIGCGRTSPTVRETQDLVTFPIRLEDSCIVISRDGHEELTVRDEVEQRETGPIRVAYAVVSRCPDLMEPRWQKTILAANHGRAAEGASLFVTDEAKLADVADRFKLQNGFPKYLQLLLRVRLSRERRESKVTVVDLVGHAFGEPNGRGTVDWNVTADLEMIGSLKKAAGV